MAVAAMLNRQGARRALVRGDGDRVPGTGGDGHRGGRDVAVRTGPPAVLQCAAGDVGTAGDAFDAAARAAGAQLAVQVDADVADVPGVARRAGTRGAVEDESAADARRHDEAERVVVAPGGAEPVLGGRHRDSVAHQRDRQPVRRLVHPLHQGEGPPAGHVDRADRARRRVDRGAADADGAGRAPQRRGHQLAQHLVHGAHDRLGALPGGRRPLRPYAEGTIAAHQRAGDLGAADVERGDEVGMHRCGLSGSVKGRDLRVPTLVCTVSILLTTLSRAYARRHSLRSPPRCPARPTRAPGRSTAAPARIRRQDSARGPDRPSFRDPLRQPADDEGRGGPRRSRPQDGLPGGEQRARRHARHRTPRTGGHRGARLPPQRQRPRAAQRPYGVHRAGPGGSGGPVLRSAEPCRGGGGACARGAADQRLQRRGPGAGAGAGPGAVRPSRGRADRDPGGRRPPLSGAGDQGGHRHGLRGPPGRPCGCRHGPLRQLRRVPGGRGAPHRARPPQDRLHRRPAAHPHGHRASARLPRRHGGRGHHRRGRLGLPRLDGAGAGPHGCRGDAERPRAGHRPVR